MKSKSIWVFDGAKRFRKVIVNGKPSLSYYGVRLFKKLVVEGEPNPILIDELYEEEAKKQYIEEIVLLVRALSFDHAYIIAEMKTMEYEEPFINIYGQKAYWKIADSVDCFIIGDELESGTEVYSTYHAIDINKTANDYINDYVVPHSGCRKGRFLDFNLGQWNRK